MPTVPAHSLRDSSFDAVVFAVHDCGFVALCALEASDSGEARIDKILAIIANVSLGFTTFLRISGSSKARSQTLRG